MIKLSKYMDARLIAFLKEESRDAILREMVEVINSSGKINNKEEFLKAIIGRESIVSTGIGMGVAIPHAKLAAYDAFFIGIGLLEKGVDWDALDGAHVRIVFMIGGPDDKQTEYLQILSGLTLAIKDEERRKKMLSLKSSEDIIELFTVFELGE